jgi:hypothetical protein
MPETTEGSPTQDAAGVPPLPAGTQIPAQRAATPTAPRSGLAMAAVALAAIGFVAAFGAPPLGGVIGLVGIVCAIRGFYRINRDQRTGRNLATVGLLASAAATLFALGHTSTANSATSAAGASSTAVATPTVVAATAIGDDFERNQIAAEKKWGSQFVQFTATVSNINSSGVSFQDVTSKEFSLTQINCSLKDDSQALPLAKGSPATVRGIVGSDQILGVISLNDCEVVGH